jgi:UDP-GlcNAc:undecaprenyl-phosphate GlcNAc-1-phosphate transferase
MGITNTEYFLLFVIAYLLVGVLTPVMRKIAIATDVVDRPNSSHKSHKKPVPYLGGVAIIIGVITSHNSLQVLSGLLPQFLVQPYC